MIKQAKSSSRVITASIKKSKTEINGNAITLNVLLRNERCFRKKGMNPTSIGVTIKNEKELISITFNSAKPLIIKA